MFVSPIDEKDQVMDFVLTCPVRFILNEDNSFFNAPIGPTGDACSHCSKPNVQ